MTDSDFTLDLAISLFESPEQFPIDLWKAGEWLGYSRKDSAKRFFMSCRFKEGVHYSLHKIVETVNNGAFSYTTEEIKLSVDCFKMWGMMARSDRGDQVRDYFLECEEIAKKKEVQRKQEFNAFIQTHARIYKPEFQKEFYDELYRVTGCIRPKRGQNPYTALLIHEYVYKMFGQEVLDEVNRVNPIIGYYTYEVPKASPEDVKALKAKIKGQKSAVTVYTRNGKLGKAKKAQKKVDSYIAKLKRWEKPHSIKLPKRAQMNHQFCSDLIGLPSLQQHLQSMVQIMRTLPTDDHERFDEAMKKAFPEGAIKNVLTAILDIPRLN